MKSILLIPVSFLFLTACNQSKKQIEKNIDQVELINSIVKPMEGLDPGAKTFVVSAIKGDTVLLENGGSVIFEANSFVDQNGDPIKGKVDVNWQEFHTLGDIMASGIPMKYDSAGVANDLISGGMFTIGASQDGKELKMAPGKSAEVNLVSLQDTPCYNFYSLDDKTGKWSYKTTKNGEVVEKKSESKKNSSAIIDVNLPLGNFAELKDLEIVGWYTKSNLSRAQKNWLKNRANKMKLERSDNETWYNLKTLDREGKGVTYEVRPYTMSEAQAESKKNKNALDKQLNEIEDYERRLASGKVVRSISVPGFGTYNWDIVYKRKNSRKLFAKFHYPGNPNMNLINLSLLSPDENVIVKYDAKEDANFSFDPGKRNCLIAISHKNELFVVSNSQFRKAKNAKDGSTYDFTFKETGIYLKSPQDIMLHMNKII